MNKLLSASAQHHKSHSTINNRIVLAGAIALVTLSAAINIRYATTAFDFGIDAVLMGALVLAVTFGFVLLPSVSIKLFKSKARSFGVLAALAAVICGGVSLSNIVGASLGHRAATALDAGDAADKRRAAQDTITKAEAEIATLGAPRPALTIDADIMAVFARTPGLDDCVPRPNWTWGRTQREACKQIAELGKEKAAAGRKAALEDDIREARTILTSEKASKTVGNGDTLALLTAARKLGWVADAETVDLFKSVGTALAVELFAAVLFVLWEIGRSTEVVPRNRAAERPTPASTPLPFHQTVECNNQVVTPNQNAESNQSVGPSATGVTTEAPILAVPADVGDRLIELVRERGGELVGGLRTFGKALGVSHTEVSRVLGTLSDAGRIEVVATKRGTRIKLVELTGVAA